MGLQNYEMKLPKAKAGLLTSGFQSSLLIPF